MTLPSINLSFYKDTYLKSFELFHRALQLEDKDKDAEIIHVQAIHSLSGSIKFAVRYKGQKYGYKTLSSEQLYNFFALYLPIEEVHLRFYFRNSWQLLEMALQLSEYKTGDIFTDGNVRRAFKQKAGIISHEQKQNTTLTL